MTETTTESNGTAANNGKNGDLKGDILRQVEYYFGDFNLPKDKFLKEQVQLDDGWVPMSTMLNFKRLAKMSSDPAVILNALEESELIDIDKENQKIRRKPDVPLPEWTDERKNELMKQTVYCKGLDKSDTIDAILPFFQGFENVENVHMRMYTSKKDNSKGFKGSVFVTFKDKESAEKFLALESVTYKGAELIRKWQEEYFEDKKKEFEERKNEKQAKKQQLQKVKEAQEKEKDDDEKEDESLPKGSVLYLKGLNGETTREDIKAKLQELFEAESDIAFIYYQKGEPEAKLRFKTEGAAKDILPKIQALEKKLAIKDAEIEASVLEGEEEEAFLNQCLSDMKARKNKVHAHKRKRGGRGDGRGGKRQKAH